jgi:Ca2+-binding EF-hand superfamily protein
MSNLGMPVTSEMAAKIVLALDIDGDGVINLREFELFYKTIMAETDESTREMAKDLFSIFDVDCSGEISPNEFVSALEAFNLGFSVEDMSAILQEVDEDGDGSITFHDEFERVIKEYAPAEFFEAIATNCIYELTTSQAVSVLEEGWGYYSLDVFQPTQPGCSVSVVDSPSNNEKNPSLGVIERRRESADFTVKTSLTLLNINT